MVKVFCIVIDFDCLFKLLNIRIELGRKFILIGFIVRNVRILEIYYVCLCLFIIIMLYIFILGVVDIIVYCISEN